MQITLNLSEQQWQKLAFIQQNSQENLTSLLDKTIEQEYKNLCPENTDNPEQTEQTAQSIAWDTWVAEVKKLSVSPNISPQNNDYSERLLEKYRKQGLAL